jgi:hypothetical protein
MAKPLRLPERAGAASRRRRHRASVLALLISVCGDLERLKVSRAARLASREVAELLRAALDRETEPAAPRK